MKNIIYLSILWSLIFVSCTKDENINDASGVFDWEGNQIHHWNYNKGDYPEQVVNPTNLSEPISQPAHYEVHTETSSGHPYNDPIKPEYELPIDSHPIIFNGESK